MVQTRRYTPPALDLAEMLRYAACRQATAEVTELAQSAAQEGAKNLSLQVCWLEVPLQVTGSEVDLSFTRVTSAKLAQHLRGCEKAVVFAATVGLELDRLIARYGRLSPARGLMLQAFGAERIEALCDAFCSDLAQEYAPQGLCTTARFSPGYGDLPLESQREFFRALDCGRHIGLYLNESCLMSPSKSVTAIVGVSPRPAQRQRGCGSCTNQQCSFRRETV